MPAAANAVPVTFAIGDYAEPGFQASVRHTATYEMGDTGFYTGGTELGDLTGTLSADYDEATGVYTFQMSTLTYNSNNYPDNDYTFDITGGYLEPGVIDSWGDTRLRGRLDTVLRNSEGDPLQTYSFYFSDDQEFGGEGGPNQIVDEGGGNQRLKLWGNNWNIDSDLGDIESKPYQALGLDLSGLMTVHESGGTPGVPELNASGFSSGLALLLGSCLILAGRKP